MRVAGVAWLSVLLAVLSGCAYHRAKTTPVGDERSSRRQIETLVRDHAFATFPDLNPKTKFRVRPFNIPGLWDSMRIEVFDVTYVIEGEEVQESFALYHDGRIIEPFESFGGFGLMSGLAVNGGFYCSYSFGSGIHRSHVAVIRIEDGKMKITESGGFRDRDLFVTRGEDGKMKVQTGSFKAFNEWESAKEFGSIAEMNGQLEILNPQGRLIEPFFPRPRR